MGVGTHERLEALADAAGVCELSLDRAVVQYRPDQETEPGAQAIDDLGLGLVLEGEYAASAEVLDLGSGRVHRLDLGAELVVLDWVYATTLDYVATLRQAAAGRGTGAEFASEPLRQYCQAIALSVLRRSGFSAVTRPTFLRLGFLDIVRDLDLNDRSTVRIALGPGDHARVRFDYDHNTLLLDRRRGGVDVDLERTLFEAFPAAEVRRTPRGAYQLRFVLPLTLGEARELTDEIRQGLLRLYARFEPERHQAVRQALEIFGPRHTLAQLERRERAAAAVRLRLLSGSLVRDAVPGVA